LLARRVVSAAVLAPLVILTVAVGGWWYVGLVAVASVLAAREFYLMLRHSAYSPLWPFGVALSLAFILDAAAPLLPLATHPGQIAYPALGAAIALSLAYLVSRQQVERSFADWAVTWAPPLYIGFLAAFLVALRLLPSGERWVFMVLAVTWSTDIGAYLVGSSLGRHPFFARVSPRKTWEGAIGGLMAGALAGGGVAWAFGWDTGQLLALSILASVAAEAGDLAESCIKRQLRTKDTSRLIPGHGGVLDRMDSLLFAGTLIYFWALVAGGSP